jgi:crossover junction endodeoxyribonuclease RuvC
VRAGAHPRGPGFVRVLGIDPGITNTGYALVIEDGRSMSAGGHGTVKTSSTDEMSLRLDILYEGVKAALLETGPDVAALEQLFFNVNVKTAMSVGQARGVILLACRHAGVPCEEYTPLEVKQAVAGSGGAPKEQVEFMVKALLGIGKEKGSSHAFDAYAIAICHLNCRRLKERLAGS